MSLNLTLLGQMLTFLVFVWFTMKYVWPPITKALDERQKKIADGLEAAEQGQRNLELSERKMTETLREAKLQASHILEEAAKRSDHMIEEAREAARVDGEQMIVRAQEQIEQEVTKAKATLRNEIGAIAIDAAGKILRQSIDADKHKELIENAAKEISYE